MHVCLLEDTSDGMLMLYCFRFENFAEEIYVDGNLVNVELMDTAGQEESDRIRLLAYRKVHDITCILIYYYLYTDILLPVY